jgi:hypothetical protein
MPLINSVLGQISISVYLQTVCNSVSTFLKTYVSVCKYRTPLAFSHVLVHVRKGPVSGCSAAAADPKSGILEGLDHCTGDGS